MGAPRGNQNAVTHGRYSKPYRAATEEQRKRGAKRAANAPKTDYAAIADQLWRLKQEQEGR